MGYGALAGPGMYRQNVFIPPGQVRTGDVPSPWIRNVKLAGGIVGIVAMFGFIGGIIVTAMNDGQPDAQPAAITALSLMGLCYLMLLGSGILNLIWIYQFWSWIPPEQRHTNMWKKYISPGQALGFMFIPYFNIYWMFVIFLGIHDVLDRMRVAYPTQEIPSKTKALVALIVPLLFFPAAPIVHFFFEKHAERIAREMQSRMPATIG